MHFQVTVQYPLNEGLTLLVLNADLSAKLETMLTDHVPNDETVDCYLADVESSLHLVNLWLSISTSVGTRPLRKLDNRGRVLWNLCMRLRRDMTTEELRSNKERLVLHAWLLGFQFLELSRQQTTGKDEAIEAGYMLELVLAVGGASINSSEFNIARLALQRGAAYISKLEVTRFEPECSDTSFIRVWATYYTMRMLLVSVWCTGSVGVSG